MLKKSGRRFQKKKKSNSYDQFQVLILILCVYLPYAMALNRRTNLFAGCPDAPFDCVQITLELNGRCLFN